MSISFTELLFVALVSPLNYKGTGTENDVLSSTNKYIYLILVDISFLSTYLYPIKSHLFVLLIEALFA